MKPRLHVLICSTRPGRVGPAIAAWAHEFAKSHNAFESKLVDLAAFSLPVFDEPAHPRLQKYHHPHTKAGSKSVGEADAFLFVMPEYIAHFSQHIGANSTFTPNQFQIASATPMLDEMYRWTEALSSLEAIVFTRDLGTGSRNSRNT